jgi:hypothetical protein
LLPLPLLVVVPFSVLEWDDIDEESVSSSIAAAAVDEFVALPAAIEEEAVLAVAAVVAVLVTPASFKWSSRSSAIRTSEAENRAN